MEYVVKNHPDSYLITLRGAFTFNDNVAFSNVLTRLETTGHTKVIIDFTDVEFIDSAALGMLLMLREEQQQRRCHITLRHAQGQVKKMFDLSKFSDLFTLEE